LTVQPVAAAIDQLSINVTSNAHTARR